MLLSILYILIDAALITKFWCITRLQDMNNIFFGLLFFSFSSKVSMITVNLRLPKAHVKVHTALLGLLYRFFHNLAFILLPLFIQ
jgi:hypothetical protein